MWAYTEDQCHDWLKQRERALPTESGYRFHYEHNERFAYFSSWLADHVTYKQPVLLWITEWGIWPSSENWHLYYLLRKSYGESRLLEEAPGHLFLDFEAADLRSFLQVALMNGWGGYLLTGADYVNLFFSHDSYMDFYSTNSALLDEVKAALH